MLATMAIVDECQNLSSVCRCDDYDDDDGGHMLTTIMRAAMMHDDDVLVLTDKSIPTN